MRPLTRIDEYRRRRHRGAAKRRGFTHRIPAACASPAANAARGNGGGFEGRGDAREALDILSQRLTAYIGVVGLLYRRHGGPIEVCIVARRPMTKPMQLLVSAWAEELWDLCPGLDWSFTVVSSPPDDADTYRCAFWSQG
jgi:hypothetical protein